MTDATSNMTDAPTASSDTKKDKAAAPRAALDAMLAGEAAINPQVNRSLKKARKADKKKARRAARSSLSSGEEGGDYDFGRDFYAGEEGEEVSAAAELSDDDEL